MKVRPAIPSQARDLPVEDDRLRADGVRYFLGQLRPRSERVPVSRDEFAALREFQRERNAAGLKAGKRVPAWVFVNSDGTALDGDNVRHRVFYRLLERANLRQIRFHDLRHTYASLLIQNGAPLTYVKEQMGHSSIQVTVDVYGHLVPSANRAGSGPPRRDPNPQPRRNRRGKRGGER